MIRQATQDDTPALVALGRDMHAESNYASIDYCPEHVARFLAWLRDSEHGLVAVAVEGDTVIGYLLGLAVPAWFGNGKDLIAEELGLYVRPSARRAGVALELARAYKDWGLALGARQLRAGSSAGEAGHAAGRLYEGLGFDYTGGCFLYDVTLQPQRDAA